MAQIDHPAVLAVNTNHECGIVLLVGKGVNVIIKQVSLLVDSEVDARQFVFLVCSVIV